MYAASPFSIMKLYSPPEEAVIVVVQWLRLMVECVGVVVVALGICITAAQFARSFRRRDAGDFTPIRLTLARYLALALEFQLGADILSTAVNPNIDEIKRLGAIAVIRTGLNFFLGREMREERETVGAERQTVAHGKDNAATEPKARKDAKPKRTIWLNPDAE